MNTLDLACKRKEAHQAPSVSLAHHHAWESLCFACGNVVRYSSLSWTVISGRRFTSISFWNNSSSAAFSCGVINGKSSLFPPRYRGERWWRWRNPFPQTFIFLPLAILQTIFTIVQVVSFNRVVESTQGYMVVALAALVVWEERLVLLHRHLPSTWCCFPQHQHSW